MPSDFVGKGRKLTGGETLDTTTHTFRESPRLQELRKAIQAGDDVTGEDGVTITLTEGDVQDIRAGTQRGMNLLQLITQKEKASTSTASTSTAPSTKEKETQAPVNVRMTRSAIAALRDDSDEKKRKRIARALAQLAT